MFRLRPVVENAGVVGGRIAFSVRAEKKDLIDVGGKADFPGVRRDVVRRRGSAEGYRYGSSPGGAVRDPGQAGHRNVDRPHLAILRWVLGKSFGPLGHRVAGRARQRE
ncbi:hypothetical protein [Streptomyces griseoruber]|nr:hypothetical protein [Streptomyces griseoruber]